MRAKSWQVGLLSLVVTILLIATSTARQHQRIALQSPAPTSTILVAAAASLQKSLQEVTRLYTKTNPSQKIDYNFAASGALQQQIEQGAPVDVFISAADKQMKALQAKGLVLSGTQKNLLTNQLVLITPTKSPVALTNFSQLVQPQINRIAIGETRTVPAGQYATEVLKNLKIFDRVKSKFVLGNNVRSVLTAVETGDVEAGIVYLTDAKSSARVTIAATADEKLHAPITYPIAVLKSSKSPDAARNYVDFLQSNSAKAVFKKYGFGIAKP
jgi:molybdate transport system substrate-binding protein